MHVLSSGYLEFKALINNRTSVGVNDSVHNTTYRPT